MKSENCKQIHLFLEAESWLSDKQMEESLCNVNLGSGISDLKLKIRYTLFIVSTVVDFHISLGTISHHKG